VDGKKAEVGSRDESDGLLERLRRSALAVADVERKERRKPPSPPFITSTLQQEAARLLRFSPAHTMAVAQRLYEGQELGDEGRVGLITYMRTDSVRLANDAVEVAREVIATRFGADYLPPKPIFYRNKKSAQDAHEAIRPTAAARTPQSVAQYLGRDEQKLYALIWSRFLASQMTPAVYDQTVADVSATDAGAAWADLRAAGSVLRFDGYLAAWRDGRENRETREEAESNGNGEEEFPEGALPGDLAAGQKLSLVDLKGDQRFTEPPPRFSEATLVRELEERGIGRPSTYATIVGTIQSKGYVNRAEGKLRPTEMGRVVNDLLVAHFPDVVDPEFTARMEEDLDEIEEGRRCRVDLLQTFYDGFSSTLKKATTEMRSVKQQAMPAGVDCEKCGKPMLVRFGKNGSFLGCSGFPACRNTREFDRDANGQVAAREVQEVGACPTCGKPLLVRSGRFGKFIACSTYPECKYTRPFTRPEHCPEAGCDGFLAERVSRKGKRFFSCSNYPKCKFITSHEPVDRPCPKCGAPTTFSRAAKATSSRPPRCLRTGCAPARKTSTRKGEAEEPAESEA
jgi:DNA topoisomerase-1